MKISCPYCDYSKEIDPAKLPPGAKRATCPKCKQKFDLDYSASGMTTDQNIIDGPPPIPGSHPGPPPLPTAESLATPLEIPQAREDLATEIKAGRQPEPVFGPPPLPVSSGPQAEYDPGQPWPGAESPTPEGLPWEERSGSLISDLWTTTKEVLFKPNEFFHRMPATGGHKTPLTYAMIVGSVGGIFGLFWQALFAMFGSMLGTEAPDIPMMWLIIGMIGVMILLPLLILLTLYLMAAFQHLMLMIVGGADGGFEATLRVLAYGSAANIWNIVPILGGLMSGVWLLVLMIIGLPIVHQTSAGRVVVAVLVIPFIFIIALIAVAVFIAVQFMH
ncbi:MAG: zinc-ribbon domain-containing protein [Deltaproteobacteria bacterium]|nr:zinc-ribbon domain-containing protein [Deltaproteobacteria bacterium]